MLKITDINLESIDAVIFDLDGTLYNRRHLPRRLVVGEIGRLGIFARERAARKEMKGKYFGSEEAFFDEFFNIMGEGNSERVKQARNWYDTDYMPLMIRVLRMMYNVEPWVIELAGALRAAGKKIAVYSDYGCVREKMLALGVDPSLADIIVSAPELGGLKPAPECMQKLIEMLGVDAARCLMVGDRDDTDGESARAVGAQFLQIDNEKNN